MSSVEEVFHASTRLLAPSVTWQVDHPSGNFAARLQGHRTGIRAQVDGDFIGFIEIDGIPAIFEVPPGGVTWCRFFEVFDTRPLIQVRSRSLLMPAWDWVDLGEGVALTWGGTSTRLDRLIRRLPGYTEQRREFVAPDSSGELPGWNV